ncbi:hypothetical protein JZU54_03810, partial [bacterium]|nr:hypothetical protein [bacterium]
MTEFDFDRAKFDREAAALLLRDYFEMKSELEAYEAKADDLRRDLTVLVEALGGSYKLDHVGTAIITPASTSHSYDTKAIDGVIAKALQDGDVHTAQALADA